MLAGAALLALAVGAPSRGYAQGTTPPAADTEPTATEAGTSELEEIVITAQRREENLQDVPIAVAAATAETLENAGIDSTLDVPAIVPSVQMTRSGASGLLFIRGVGTTNAAVG